MPDEDTIIELPSDSPPEPKVEEKVVTTEEVSPPVEDLKRQLEELTAATAAEKARAEASTREAETARQEAARAAEDARKAEKALSESNASVLDNAIAAAEAEAAGYQRDQQAAFEAGDFAKAAEFGRKMAKAEARIATFEAGKADLELRGKQEAEKPKAERVADPFEASISNLSLRTKDWFRSQKASGRDFIGNPKLNAQANAAHYKAVAEGLAPDTDAYFEFCETELGIREPVVESKPAKNGSGQRKSVPAAPVSREATPGGGQLSPTQVRLTPGEVAAATDGVTHTWGYDDPNGKFKKGQPIGVQEMARRKLALQKMGAYDRAYAEG